MVVGVCLHTIIVPRLRKYNQLTFNKLYTDLTDPSKNPRIDLQTPQNYIKIYGSNKYNLEYKNINNNHGNPRFYDYMVHTAVDLSKLFVKPVVAHYAAFDESCDASALLNMIYNTDAPDFVPALKLKANEVSFITRHRHNYTSI